VHLPSTSLPPASSKNLGYAYVPVKYKLVTGMYLEEKLLWYYAMGSRGEHQL